MDIFRVLDRSLPLYSRICTTDDGCLRMLLPIVSEQTLYKTRVDALCTAMLHSQRVTTSKLNSCVGVVHACAEINIAWEWLRMRVSDFLLGGSGDS